MRSKIYCPHGHEYTKENTSVTKLGTKKCRACKRIYNRIYKARFPKKTTRCRLGISRDDPHYARIRYKLWYWRDPEKRRLADAIKYRTDSVQLTDGYIKRVLRSVYGISAIHVTKELIELKREALAGRRLLRQVIRLGGVQ